MEAPRPLDPNERVWLDEIVTNRHNYGGQVRVGANSDKVCQRLVALGLLEKPPRYKEVGELRHKYEATDVGRDVITTVFKRHGKAHLSEYEQALVRTWAIDEGNWSSPGDSERIEQFLQKETQRLLLPHAQQLLSISAAKACFFVGSRDAVLGERPYLRRLMTLGLVRVNAHKSGVRLALFPEGERLVACWQRCAEALPGSVPTFQGEDAKLLARHPYPKSYHETLAATWAKLAPPSGKPSSGKPAPVEQGPAQAHKLSAGQVEALVETYYDGETEHRDYMGDNPLVGELFDCSDLGLVRLEETGYETISISYSEGPQSATIFKATLEDEGKLLVKLWERALQVSLGLSAGAPLCAKEAELLQKFPFDAPVMAKAFAPYHTAPVTSPASSAVPASTTSDDRPIALNVQPGQTVSIEHANTLALGEDMPIEDTNELDTPTTTTSEPSVREAVTGQMLGAVKDGVTMTGAQLLAAGVANFARSAAAGMGKDPNSPGVQLVAQLLPAVVGAGGTYLAEHAAHAARKRGEQPPAWMGWAAQVAAASTVKAGEGAAVAVARGALPLLQSQAMKQLAARTGLTPEQLQALQDQLGQVTEAAGEARSSAPEDDGASPDLGAPAETQPSEASALGGLGDLVGGLQQLGGVPGIMALAGNLMQTLEQQGEALATMQAELAELRAERGGADSSSPADGAQTVNGHESAAGL